MDREEGAPGPEMRRATALPQVSGPATPAFALTPRAPVAGSRAAGAGAGATARNAPAGGEPGEGEPAGRAAGRTGTTGGTPEPAVAPDTIASAEPASATEPASPDPASATEPASSAEPAGASAVLTTAGGVTDPPATATTADGEQPSTRPNRPLLAAAAIGGTLLVGVPLLLLGTGDDSSRTQPAAATRISTGVLPHDRTQDPGTPGSYAPASPSATSGPVRVAKQPTGSAPAASGAAEARTESGDAAKKQAVTEEPAEKTATPSAAARRLTARAGGALPTGANFSSVSGVVIKNRMTGLCVDVPNYGKGTLNGTVDQFTCDGSTRDNQRWDLVVNGRGAGPGGADLFTIRNSKDHYCLDLPDYGAKPARTGVHEWHCNPGAGDNQMWFLDEQADGFFRIRNHKSSGLCLDVAGLGGSGGRGAHLTLYGCSAQDDHLWLFT